MYSAQKISLQCLSPQFVVINDVKRYCDATSLNFIDFPEKIMVGNVTVLSHHIPHHFSSRLDYINSGFRSVSIFMKTDQSDPTIGQDIVSFFETASPIQYSLVVTGFCLAILIIVLLLCVCYLKVPQCLTGLLCCFSKECCLRKRVLA